MLKFSVLAIAAVTAVTAASGASAQDASYYTCYNKPVRIAIDSVPLDDALAQFTKATRCPVSRDVKKVGDADAGTITTTVTKGRYTPAQALRMILRNTPFKSRTIKGGFSVYN